jgi:hypothetical protein
MSPGKDEWWRVSKKERRHGVSGSRVSEPVEVMISDEIRFLIRFAIVGLSLFLEFHRGFTTVQQGLV